MNIIEKQTVKHYHQHRAQNEEYTNAQKQGWTSDEVQQLRFEVITSLANFDNSSVLDVGCGMGDFKTHLDQKARRFDYIGIDQQAEFIEEAKKNNEGQQGIWFYEADVATCRLPQMDVVVASGLLSYRSEDSHYYFNMIERLYQAADSALIFNMLNDETFESTELLVAHNKEQIEKYCRTLSDEVVIIDDYLQVDFTVCIQKDINQR